jgi:hypothetical protein
MADEKKKQELIVKQLAGKHRFKEADDRQEYVKFIDRALSLKKRMDDAIEAKNFKLCDQLNQQAIVKDFPMTFEDFDCFKVVYPPPPPFLSMNTHGSKLFRIYVHHDIYMQT